MYTGQIEAKNGGKLKKKVWVGVNLNASCEEEHIMFSGGEGTVIRLGTMPLFVIDKCLCIYSCRHLAQVSTAESDVQKPKVIVAKKEPGSVLLSFDPFRNVLGPEAAYMSANCLNLPVTKQSGYF